MKHLQTNGPKHTDKENKMATRIQEGGGGMGSSGSFKAKAKAKVSGAIVSSIKGKASGAKTAAASSRNSVKAAEARAALKSARSKPPLAEPKSGVKVIKPGTKPLTKPTSPYIAGQPMSGTRRSIAELQRMGYTTKELKSMGLLR